MKSSRNPRGPGGLLALILLGMTLAACGGSQTQVVCPINYDAARAECAKAYVWSTKSDSSQPPAAAPNGGTPAPAP